MTEKDDSQKPGQPYFCSKRLSLRGMEVCWGEGKGGTCSILEPHLTVAAAGSLVESYSVDQKES